MPELPEVETLRRGLERHLVGRTIVDARILVPKMLKGSVSDPEAFRNLLRNQRIKSVERRGKHLIIPLESGYYLLLHLKMRGQVLIAAQEAPDGKYLALTLVLENAREMRFHDMWTWGEARLLTAEELASHPPLAAMGTEPLSEAFTAQEFSQSLRRRAKTSVKAALLDQTVVAGIGNIYADESLFRAGVRPLRPAGALTEGEAERLRDAIRAVLNEATGDGGTVSDNYADADGRAGRYAPQVYDRGGKPCVSCGTELIRIQVIGRGTVYCPDCQS